MREFLRIIGLNIADELEDNISSDILKGVLAHESEAKIHNVNETWEKGIKGRAAYRGHQIGVGYAEAFEVESHA